jgi:hypothetical protein
VKLWMRLYEWNNVIEKKQNLILKRIAFWRKKQKQLKKMILKSN